jgi:hypothetical protein
MEEKKNFENIRVFYQSAQERRRHLSQIIVTNIGYAITLNAAILGFFGKGYIDSMASQYNQQRELSPWYLLVAAFLSSIVIILWRWYTHYLDNMRVNDAYSKIVFCEHELKVDDLLTMWRHFAKKHTSKGSGSTREKELMELSSTERMKFVSELSRHRRYGCRGHNTFNLIALVYMVVMWTVSMVGASYSHSALVAWLSLFGFFLSGLIFTLLFCFYFQKDPSETDIREILAKAKNNKGENAL